MTKEFEMNKLSELVDEVMHLTQLATYANSYYVVYNDPELAHAELEKEIDEFSDEINDAVHKFQHTVKAKLWAVLSEINKRGKDA